MGWRSYSQGGKPRKQTIRARFLRVKINRIGFTKNKISVKAEHTLDTLDNYKKDSFINELASLLMKNNRDIRNEIKDFVNSNDNLEYLKELTRSYKKFRINIHNILLNENIDKIITDELLTIICKVYDINIIKLSMK